MIFPFGVVYRILLSGVKMIGWWVMIRLAPLATASFATSIVKSRARRMFANSISPEPITWPMRSASKSAASSGGYFFPKGDDVANYHNISSISLILAPISGASSLIFFKRSSSFSSFSRNTGDFPLTGPDQTGIRSRYTREHNRPA